MTSGSRPPAEDVAGPRVVVGPVEADEAEVFLARIEAETGVPPVDEDELRRLAGRPPLRDRDWSWSPHLVRVDGLPVAYAGLRSAPVTARSRGVGSPQDRLDLALDRSRAGSRAALLTGLDALLGPADVHAPTAQAWLRDVTPEDLEVLGKAGFTLGRRLHVLGLATGTLPPGTPRMPAGVRLRHFVPDDDDAAVARLLRAVYPGSSGAWDADGVALRRAAPWFHAEDLLLAEGAHEGVDPEDLLGVHWTKRRSERLGEVHNLAVHPAVQGRSIGPALLDAGLAHLRDVGSEEVVLWVDARNVRAHDLYRSRGFTPRWDDVALVR
jgi:mycothiol synthase